MDYLNLDNYISSSHNKRCQTATIATYLNQIPPFTYTPFQYNDLKYVKRLKSARKLDHKKLLTYRKEISSNNNGSNLDYQPLFTEIPTHIGHQGKSSYYHLTNETLTTNGDSSNSVLQKYGRFKQMFYSNNLPKLPKSANTQTKKNVIKEISFNGDVNNNRQNIEQQPIRLIDLNLIKYSTTKKEKPKQQCPDNNKHKQQISLELGVLNNTIKEYNEYLKNIDDKKFLADVSQSILDSNKLIFSKQILKNNSKINKHYCQINNNKFIQELINRVSRKITYINQHNETITQDDVMNLLSNEYTQINENVDQNMEAFCKIKNFSLIYKQKLNTTSQTNYYLLPYINQIVQPFFINKPFTSENDTIDNDDNVHVTSNESNKTTSKANNIIKDFSIKKQFILDKEKRNDSFDSKKRYYYNECSVSEDDDNFKEQDYVYFKIMMQFSRGKNLNPNITTKKNNNNINEIIESSSSSEEKLIKSDNELQNLSPETNEQKSFTRKSVKKNSTKLTRNLSTQNLSHNRLELEKNEIKPQDKSVDLSIEEVISHTKVKFDRKLRYESKKHSLKIQPVNKINKQQPNHTKNSASSELVDFLSSPGSVSMNSLVNNFVVNNKTKSSNSNTIKTKISQNKEKNTYNPTEPNQHIPKLNLKTITQNKSVNKQKKQITRKNRNVSKINNTTTYFNKSSKQIKYHKEQNTKVRNISMKLKVQKSELTTSTNNSKKKIPNTTTTNTTQSLKQTETNSNTKTNINLNINENPPPSLKINLPPNEKNNINIQPKKENTQKSDRKSRERQRLLRLMSSTPQTFNNESDKNKEILTQQTPSNEEKNNVVITRPFHSKKTKTFIISEPTDLRLPEVTPFEFINRIGTLRKTCYNNELDINFNQDENQNKQNKEKNAKLSKINNKLKKLLSKQINYSCLDDVKNKITELKEIDAKDYINELHRQFQEEKKVIITDKSDQSLRINAFIEDLIDYFNQRKLRKDFFANHCKVADFKVQSELSEQKNINEQNTNILLKEQMITKLTSAQIE